ncbi:MAG: methyltransferase domain-containing protein, partial [Pseudomonadota bacterium]
MTAPDLIDHGFIRHQLHRRGPVLAGAPHPLVTRAVEDIALRLEAVLRPFGTAAVISPVPTMLPGLLASRAQTHCVLDGRVFGGPLQPMQSPDGSARLLWADPTGGSDAHAQPMADIVPLLLDHEAMAFADASLDLVISLLTMQAVNDLPGHLVQIRRALRPDGLFLGVAFGDDT